MLKFSVNLDCIKGLVYGCVVHEPTGIEGRSGAGVVTRAAMKEDALIDLASRMGAYLRKCRCGACPKPSSVGYWRE
jgi:hypothetical protein